MTTSVIDAPAARVRGAGRRFYLAMGVIMAAIVVYGFSQTIVGSLIQPKIPRPAILWVHGAVFSSWLALFLVQTALVSSRNVAWHRRLGLAWIFVGAAVPILGVTTTIVMRRFDIIHFHDTLPFMAVPLWDMIGFTTCFALAVAWRRRPELHRRLMFLALCNLIDAGLGRFPVPDAWFNGGWFYFAVDALVLAAMARDYLVERRVHRVFLIALPLMAIGQYATWSLWRHPPDWFLAFARAVVGVG